MRSAGNDIVALQAINRRRSCDRRFYSKILTPSEQELYSRSCTALSFDLFLWLLWSVKESAYKYLKRDTPQLVFSPVKFVVTEIAEPASFKISDLRLQEGAGFPEEVYCTKVSCLNSTLYSRSFINEEAISTVVNDTEDFTSVGWGIRKTCGEDLSAEVRSFLMNRLNPGGPGTQVTKDNAGCPQFMRSGKGIPISFSHHGQYVGYSFLIDGQPGSSFLFPDGMQQAANGVGTEFAEGRI